MLSPQGKIDSFTRVTVLGENRFLLDVPSGFGEGLRQRLARFKLRVKAELSEVTELTQLEVRGPRTPSAAELSSWAAGAALAVVDVRWPPLAGRDVLALGVLPASGPAGCVRLEADDAAFEAARIEGGMPELGRELTERTIAQEAGELVAHAVSFTKGCYTGQELVARVDARGSNTPRRLRGVVIEGDGDSGSSPSPGDALVVDAQSVGSLTSVAWSAGLGGHVALAFVKRGVDTSESAQVVTALGPVPAALRMLPLVRAESAEVGLQTVEKR